MPMAAPGNGNYSCRTATETLEWIHSIIRFIHPYRFLIDAHVVNFFKDRLWEYVDKEWLDSLRSEPVENLLQIPSGAVQDHWPASLKDFVVMLRSLALPREQADLKKVLPDICITPLNKVISQGMNQKKKHEIEVLSAVVSSIARSVRTNTTIDVGAGQGYLAQVLSFHYQLSVIAIDACSHHGRITDARAERIKKHYEAMMRKSRLENRELSMPTTVTCHVLSTDTLKMLSNSLILKEDSSCLLLAGLHACGDLSVTMLRTFLECEEVKAVVSIGCCYNLLSEDDGDENAGCGFPMSGGVKSAGFSLGKSSRDLACQSAERWRGLGEDAGLHNFELHAFRAAFQMVLYRHYPEILMRSSPTIGRQGKALRRQQNRAMRESSLLLQPQKEESLATMKKHAQTEPYAIVSHGADSCCNDTATIITEKITSTYVNNKLSNFEKFSKSGLCRLGLTQHSQDIIDLAGIWKESEPFAELIGPYWTLRAALGPVLETLILLDRLLFLQEQGNDSVEALLLPIFDPTLSPRNMALIAKKI